MRLLLDTHVLIWAQERPEKLGLKTIYQLEKRTSELYVSPISTLEIARLVAAERIRLETSLESWIEANLTFLRCLTLEVTHHIARTAYELPGTFHRDPADRILVATARSENLTLVTGDQKILDYGHVSAMDARR